jgi:hypothetical protein
MAKKATELKVSDKKEVTESPSALSITPQERQFASAYFEGETAGNGTRSYLAIHPDCSYDAASVEASTLLRQPNVRAFLEHLHQEAIGLTVGKLMPWIDLLPMAQNVIIATAQGRLRNRLAYEAAVHLCARGLGSPVSVASTEIVVRDEARILKAVSAFTKRIAEDQRTRAREVAAV